MQWLVTNWFWVLIGIAFVWMHLFGHGGHGGHGAMGAMGAITVRGSPRTEIQESRALAA